MNRTCRFTGALRLSWLLLHYGAGSCCFSLKRQPSRAESTVTVSLSLINTGGLVTGVKLGGCANPVAVSTTELMAQAGQLITVLSEVFVKASAGGNSTLRTPEHWPSLFR